MCGEECCGVDSSCVLWRRKAKGDAGWESGQPQSGGGAGGSDTGHGGAPSPGPVWGVGRAGVPCPRVAPRLPWFANKVFETFVSTALGTRGKNNVRGGAHTSPWKKVWGMAMARRDAFAAPPPALTVTR